MYEFFMRDTCENDLNNRIASKKRDGFSSFSL